jgi:hypothetical protein
MKMEVGQRISYKAKGKLARLEQKAGKVVTGVIQRIGDDATVTVLPDYRTEVGAIFKNLAAVIETKAIIKSKVKA